MGPRFPPLGSAPAIMSDSKELKGVVERILQENRVALKGLFEFVLPSLAGQLWAAGLIEKHVADIVGVSIVDHIMRTAKLFDACQTSLVQYPGKNFPKFIEVLKRFVTIKQLAEKMESEFEQARESNFNDLVAHA